MGKYEANIATGKQWLKLAGITLVILFTVLRTRARACDTWVAMPDATTDHSVILAKNSDRPPIEAQPLVQLPHQMHPPGEKGEMYLQLGVSMATAQPPGKVAEAKRIPPFPAAVDPPQRLSYLGSVLVFVHPGALVAVQMIRADGNRVRSERMVG
jgi:hypothetical protein